MPDVITHYLFGLDTSKALKSPGLYQVIKENKNLFFVGLQGPDPMYYHKPYTKNNYASIAKLMHEEKTKDFLLSFVVYLKKIKDTPDLFRPALSYFSGFLCHYVLDYMAHPYIFYIGGKYDKDIPESIVYQGLHKKIELAIDTLLLQEKFALKASQFKVHKHILKDIAIPTAISTMYEEALSTTYGIPNGGDIFTNSYRSFRSYHQFTYDPVGSKKLFATSVKSTLPKRMAFYANCFSYHNCTSPYVDYLNTTKKVWLHPVTGNVYTFSFYDILHNSLKIAVNLLTTVYQYLEGDSTYEMVVNSIPNYAYTTGLVPSDTRPIKYISPDYKKL